MSEEEIKQIWDNLFNKLNETEKTFLAIISNEKNKQIEELKSQLQQQENIIKEVQKKLNTQLIKTVSAQFNYECATYIIEQAKQILDKENKQ